MRNVFLLVLCTALTACDYTVPLSKRPAIEMDSRLIGLWEQIEVPDHPQPLLVLPLNSKECVISFASDGRGGILAKASRVDCAGKSLIQVEWIGTERGTLPATNRIHQVISYEIEKENTLRIRTLNTAVVSKDIKTSKELIKAIEENKDKPDLFTNPMAFKKVAE